MNKHGNSIKQEGSQVVGICAQKSEHKHAKDFLEGLSENNTGNY
jgi:hypothetical protein